VNEPFDAMGAFGAGLCEPGKRGRGDPPDQLKLPAARTNSTRTLFPADFSILPISAPRMRRLSLGNALKFGLLLALGFSVVPPASALEGQVQIHDPSAVVRCDGKFYCYGTGGAALVSDDGWSWRRGVSPGPIGTAPDVFHAGDRYCLYIATNAGAPPEGVINMIWSKTLDPASPGYKWQDGGVVVATGGFENADTIEPGVFHDPTDGRLWLTYGSNSRSIQLVELDPATGKRLKPDAQPVDIAATCEASDMMYHDGWYYLFANHGACCAGANSTYNIRVGRSKKVTGPFLDNEGVDMLQGGGRLFAGSSGHVIGPGHFRPLNLDDGVQKFSCYYEADLDRGGASVLDIRPLLWKNGWPVAGENFKGGDYEIESAGTGTALALAVQDEPAGGAASGAGLGGRDSLPPSENIARASANWPAGNIAVRLADYVAEAQQKWSVTAATNAGGCPGSPYFKITIAGMERALEATQAGNLVAAPAFTGAPEQLWRLDELAGGAWRIMPKSAQDNKAPPALWAVNISSVLLTAFNPDSDMQRWLFKTP
jgi:arabinan endo-1,5-alpha-L-arabinosidase